MVADQHGFTLRSISDLLPYARNSRTHSDDQVAQLAASIDEFGLVGAIVVRDGTIAKGHGTLAAVRKLIEAGKGIYPPPGRSQGADAYPNGLVPAIDASGWSDAQFRAYVIADNKLALNAGWDLDMLRIELEELQTEGFDLSLTGFELDEIKDLLTPEQLDPNGKDPDAIPDVPPDPHSVLGDVWILGAHRVMCGDSTMLDSWDTLMAGEMADIVWTDPPYNVAYEGVAGKIKNDDMGDEQFAQFLLDVHIALFSIMKPGAAIYVAHADSEGYNFRRAFKQAGLKLAGCLIWRKDQFVLGRSDYQWMHEPILYGWKQGAGHRWFGGRKQTTVLEYGEGSPFEQQADGRWVVRVGNQTFVVDGAAKVERMESSLVFHEKPARSALHPTTKPVGLVAKFLRNSARHNDIVVDAFGGSGSTLIASEEMGMCARLMELDPKFVDVICQRYYAFTGRVPVNARTGEEFPVKEKQQ
ncbi:site-specific DNA-methyltransferase [Pararobbsia silviterrae]|uniref:site-specific DNA-methyltransferase (adenine-specific) n=1 Tax=Pararobbsia silviterrae TaxID=1792498 RepID=A0A494X977_9BURK|nr:site-specific DNA-methyltransferase [Pararobbsia silviterrae]RKP44744.1 site-specific DNA-methyltransferase [Pararobbsia silviterrae]